jgi:hypothetical protein
MGPANPFTVALDESCSCAADQVGHFYNNLWAEQFLGGLFGSVLDSMSLRRSLFAL